MEFYGRIMKFVVPLGKALFAFIILFFIILFLSPKRSLEIPS